MARPPQAPSCFLPPLTRQQARPQEGWCLCLRELLAAVNTHVYSCLLWPGLNPFSIPEQLAPGPPEAFLYYYYFLTWTCIKGSISFSFHLSQQLRWGRQGVPSFCSLLAGSDWGGGVCAQVGVSPGWEGGSGRETFACRGWQWRAGWRGDR